MIIYIYIYIKITHGKLELIALSKEQLHLDPIKKSRRIENRMKKWRNLYARIHIKKSDNVRHWERESTFCSRIHFGRRCVLIHFCFVVSLYALRLSQFIVLSTRYCNKQKILLTILKKIKTFVNWDHLWSRPRVHLLDASFSGTWI